MDGMTRGELAKTCEINPETVRYYETNGLLATAKRSESGYRLFDDEAVRRIRFIKRAQAAGFTLDEIKSLLAIQTAPEGTSGDVREMVEAKIAAIEARIRALTAMKHTLRGLMLECPGGDMPTDDCPILGHFDAAENDLALFTN
jgi:DNA-binding transcriptional MerR regulator